MSTRLAIVVILAASLGGRIVCAQSLNSSRMEAFAAQNFRSVPTLAEDSPAAQSTNLTFYDSPRGPELKPPAPRAGTVSVEQLRHPLSRKGLKLLDQARKSSAVGRHDQAIVQLQIALKERSAVPYAHSMLGVEYLKTGQVPEAIAELEQAVTLLPRNVPDHSNLGYALFLSGDLGRAESEARQALELDRNNAKTQHVLTQIERARRLIAPSQP